MLRVELSFSELFSLLRDGIWAETVAEEGECEGKTRKLKENIVKEAMAEIAAVVVSFASVLWLWCG